jgi:hypothetical protein
MKLKSSLRNLIKRPSEKINLGIYQIFYDKIQLKYLDRDFIPFDNGYRIESKYPSTFEFGVIRQLFEDNIYQQYDLTGSVSWKFFQKTGLKGEKFKKWILNNPGYDVYFVNPWPEHNFLFYNVWSQGQYFHPKLIEITEQLFSSSGMEVNLLNWQRNFYTGAYCNFWVGNKYFLEKYYEFTMKIFDSIQKIDSVQKKVLFQEKADDIIKAPYFPFIFERLFSTLLELDKSIKYLNFPLWDVFPEKIHCNKPASYLITEVFPRIRSNEISNINSLGYLYHDIVFSKVKAYAEYSFSDILSEKKFDDFVLYFSAK